MQELPDVLNSSPGFVYRLPSRRDTDSFFFCLLLSPWSHQCLQLMSDISLHPPSGVDHLCVTLPALGALLTTLMTQIPLHPFFPVSFSLSLGYAAGSNGCTDWWLQYDYFFPVLFYVMRSCKPALDPRVACQPVYICRCS